MTKTVSILQTPYRRSPVRINKKSVSVGACERIPFQKRTAMVVGKPEGGRALRNFTRKKLFCVDPTVASNLVISALV